MNYEFGPYFLDSEHSLLRRRGVALPLGPRLIDTLLVLVENAGHIVSKDTLLERVWPEGFVDESSLQQNIYLLRKTLADWDQNAIETLRRRGYRFTPRVVGRESPPRAVPSKNTHNLPAPISEFLGRKDELVALLDTLANSRLTTMVGAGGIGKTRTAIEAGRAKIAHFPDGVWYIDLTALQGGVKLAHFISRILGIETPSEDPMHDLKQALRGRSTLLILDNCEHVINEAAELCETLLQACKDLVVLATSRETIRISGERVYRLPPMTNAEGMRLFGSRAAALGTNFQISQSNAATVSAIVEHLDGIPMAIELAAARMGTLTPSQLLSDLDRRLFMLENVDRVSHPRHRSLRNLVQWSYDLLSASEQPFFRALGVFQGEFDVGATVSICGENEDGISEMLQSLINKSLLQSQPHYGQKKRFRMLETVNMFARDLLVVADALPVTEKRWAEYFLAISREAKERYDIAKDESVLAEIDLEASNLRGVLQWANADLNARGRFIEPITSVLGMLKSEKRILTQGIPDEGEEAPILGSDAFVGRTRELNEVAACLEAGRLVTICGTAGIGKTRLARECGAMFARQPSSEACFLELIDELDASALYELIAQALGVNEYADDTPIARVTERCRGKSVLLVLDNCDQVREPVGEIAKALLEAAPGLRILCASRKPLEATGERVYVLRSMQVHEAIHLFKTRASAHPDHDAGKRRLPAALVAVLVDRLERVPLAIELAAAQTSTMSLGEIIVRLDRRFEEHAFETELSSHRTVEATIDWSYKLLDPPEQELFRKVSVFAADFGMETIAAVIAHDAARGHEEVLKSLVDASLLVEGVKHGRKRFVMLESMKEYALDALVSAGEFEETVDAHARFFARYVRDAHDLHRQIPTDELLDRFAFELENIRGAYNISIQRDPSLAFEIALKSVWFFYESGRPSEGRERLQAALRSVASSLAPDVHASALRELSRLSFAEAAYSRATELATEALARIRGSAVDESALPPYLNVLGNALTYTGDYAAAEQSYREAIEIAKRAGDQYSLSRGAFNLGSLLVQCFGRFDEAGDFFLLAQSANSNDMYREALVEGSLSRSAFLSNRARDAVDHIRKAYEIFARLKNIEMCLDSRVREIRYLVADDRGEEARLLFEAIRDDILRYPNHDTVDLLLDGLSVLAFFEGKYAEAAHCFRVADQHRATHGLITFPLYAQARERVLKTLEAKIDFRATPLIHSAEDALELIRTF
jgi:predicted ATPase/DNA-binding winged helix-turn-helix (wHTH) protein